MADSAHASWGTPPRGERLSATLGHRANSMLATSIVLVVALQCLPVDPLMSLVVSVTLIAFVVLCWLLMSEHDRRLCELCAAEMPLNPAEEAKRLHRRFWMAHTGSEPRFLVPYLLVLVSSNFATTTIGRVGWAVIQLSMVYLLVSQSTHRKLQPWCPWCRGDGGGEEVDETPPVLPHDDRQLV